MLVYRSVLYNETLDFIIFRPLLIWIDIEGFGPSDPLTNLWWFSFILALTFWKFDEVWGCHRNSHTFGQSTKSNVKQKNKTNNSSSDFCSNLKLTHGISCHCIWVVVSNIFYFHFENWGRPHFDDHMFQKGWFNHQLGIVWIEITMFEDHLWPSDHLIEATANSSWDANGWVDTFSRSWAMIKDCLRYFF